MLVGNHQSHNSNANKELSEFAFAAMLMRNNQSHITDADPDKKKQYTVTNADIELQESLMANRELPWLE